MNVRSASLFGASLLSLLAFVPALNAVEVSIPDERVTAKPLDEISVHYPMLARHEVYGYAEVLFVVDEQGTPDDFVVLKETHPAFSRAIIETIRSVRYEPARLDGEIVPSRVIFRNHFYFLGQAAIRHETRDSPTKLELEEMATARVHSVDELDEPLIAVHKAAPEYPEMPDTHPGGVVLVEFFVAEDGSLKAPGVVSSSHPLLSDAVLEAVENWQFEPPRISGEPVTVMVHDQFTFRAK